MAKWTITFEDVITPEGVPGVLFLRNFEGDPVDGERWTGATLLAMFLDWAWNKSWFQRAAMKYEMRVVRHHMESSDLSDEG